MKLTGKQVEQIHEVLLSGYDLGTLRNTVVSLIFQGELANGSCANEV